MTDGMRRGCQGKRASQGAFQKGRWGTVEHDQCAVPCLAYDLLVCRGHLWVGLWQEAMVLVSLTLAAPIGLSPLHILTLCGSERVLVVSPDPLDDLSCLTTPGSAVPETGCCPCR